MTDRPRPQVAYNLQVLENTHLSDNRFLLKLTKPKNFEYLPGQFAILEEQQDNGVIQRPYSIASIPEEDFMLFYIKLVPDGSLTPVLYAKKRGDSILMSGPYGHLTHETIGIPDKLVLIAIGSGIAAIRPLAHYYATFKSVELTVVHQARFRDNLIFFDELKNNSKYVPVLSKQKTDDTFYGHFPDYRDEWFDIDASYVIVGKREQVEEYFKLLDMWGVDTSRMYTEKY